MQQLFEVFNHNQNDAKMTAISLAHTDNIIWQTGYSRLWVSWYKKLPIWQPGLLAKSRIFITSPKYAHICTGTTLHVASFPNYQKQRPAASTAKSDRLIPSPISTATTVNKKQEKTCSVYLQRKKGTSKWLTGKRCICTTSWRYCTYGAIRISEACSRSMCTITSCRRTYHASCRL